MSEVFYRKWRPRRLDQVVGQELIARTLLNAVSSDRVAHAYLFCGPRGTGKTSTARILAKAVNCTSSVDGEPDDACPICDSVNNSRSLDLIEIDAASNRGIDDIRNLREKVHFTPNESRYKVYIIDEVHMLTEPAFNALLKMLEEPPGHVIFILATTEVHKVPLTIISRCQRFDFKPIPVEMAVNRLAKLCSDENIEIEKSALELIARSAVGSLRDAENLLEQAIVSYGSPLNENQVGAILGLGSEEAVLSLVTYVIEDSVKEGLGIINDVVDRGGDLRQFHSGILDCFRGMILAKSGAIQSKNYSENTYSKLSELSEQVSLDKLVRFLKIFLGVEMRRDNMSVMFLELALLESSLDEQLHKTKKLNSRSDNESDSNTFSTMSSEASNKLLTKSIKQDIVGGAPPEPSPVLSKPAPVLSKPVPVLSEPSPILSKLAPVLSEPSPVLSEPANVLDSHWDSIVKSLRTHKGKRFNLGALLRSSTYRLVEGSTITLRYSHISHSERMQEELDDPVAGKLVSDAFNSAMQGTYEINVESTSDDKQGLEKSTTQKSHIVRMAQSMGARIVGEEKENTKIEQEDA